MTSQSLLSALMMKRDEFFTFQIGVLATGAVPVTALRYDVQHQSATAAVGVNCFSLEGSSFLGRRFTQNLTVPAHSVGSLWFGANVSGAQSPGTVDRFVLCG